MKSLFRTLPLVLASIAVGVSALTTSLVVQPAGNAAEASTAISLEFVGRANSGVGNMGSEIAAFDPTSKRLFVTNGLTNQIDVFDISNPASPVLVKSVNLGALGVTGIQSVASKGGFVAAAAAVDGNNQLPGKVFLMDVNGNIDARAANGIAVGSLPDSIHFSPNGQYILTANEGEPRDYCLTGGALPTTTDPHGSVSIIDVTSKTLTATTLDLSSMNNRAAEMRSAGARIYGPGATVAQDVEPEYIAISADSKRAYVTLQENNAVVEVDISKKTITRFMGLGYKDFSLTGNGLDPSDQDSSSNSGINIANWPVKGMYQPDAIATFTDATGAHYFATANEGDAREYKCLLGGLPSASAQAEDSRVSAVGVDGTILASSVATNSNLGRLGVTRFEPSTYTAGGTALTAAASTDFTSLYTLGGRSLSIWKSPSGTADIAGATLVADTGDQIERKIAELLPNYFNGDWSTSSGTPNNKDTRSDNKGPEPEGLAVGKVFGRTIAFVGLERVGGVMAFDITNPAAPTYLSYVNSSVFTGVGGANFATAGAPAGDVSPEGLLFVKATDSPIGVPLVIVAHELSGTTAIYKVVGTPTLATQPTSVSAKISNGRATVSWVEPEDDGGQPIERYVARSIPGNKSCVTTTRSCVIKGLQAGVPYKFVVDARTAGSSSPRSEASPSVFAPFFSATAGSSVKIEKLPSVAIAQNVGVSVKSRTISAGVAAPTTTKQSTRVVRYAVELWNASGSKVGSYKTAVRPGATVTTTLKVTKAGRYRVVVVAGYASGTTKVWNGPFFAVK